MKKLYNVVLKSLLLMFAVAALSLSASSQIVTIDPADATVFDSITLTFNPAIACYQNAPLTGVPLVYMHSGVTTSAGDWQNVIAYNQTGVNGQAPHLTPNGDGTYSIGYRPSSFYGIAPGTIVTRLCMVFNDGQWGSKDGRDFQDATTCKDIFVPLHYQSSVPKFQFTVNMTKMKNNGHFDPLTDAVFVQLLSPKDTTVELTQGTGADQYKYTGMIESGLDSGETYNYKFRINDTTYETVSRTIKAMPGTTSVSVWWNDDPLASVTFQVDMFYQVALHKFSPTTDYVDIAGSMNGWDGTLYHLTRVTGTPDTVVLYQIVIETNPDTLYEYKYRINGSWATSEFPNGGPNRRLMAPETPMTKKVFYDDYQPYTVPVTMKCHMSYQIRAGHFFPKKDYLDVAGDFNGWGALDQLFNLGTKVNDSTYQATFNARKSYIGTNQFQFKFRFNGNWGTSEFPNGGANRVFAVEDTVGGHQNIIDVWYDNKNPNVPTRPWAYNLSIAGELAVGSVLTGMYTYEDCNYIPEGTSLYKWYKSDSASGVKTEIAGATALNYTLTAGELNKYVWFEVTPVAASGDSAIGYPVQKISDDKVHGTGIQNIEGTIVTFYPNPVRDNMTFELKGELSRIEIYSILGQKVLTMTNLSGGKHTLNTSSLTQGVYFLRFYNSNNSYSTAKFIKN